MSATGFTVKLSTTDIWSQPDKTPMHQPTVNSFFSGAGLMDEGLRRAGLNVQASYEIDPDCVRIACDNGHQANVCDVSRKLVADEAPSDIAVVTYPCTHYSTIADIHGARTGDNLYLHFFRHLAICQYEVYVLENVPGMRKFPIVMEAMTKLPGYYVNVFCPVQSQTWLPQKRDRLFIIGSKRNFLWRSPAATRRVSLAEIIEENPRVEIPDYVYSRLDGKYRDRPIISDPALDDLAPTCVAHYAKDLGTRLLKDKRYPRGVRPYSVREWARLQGLPDTYQFNCSDRLAYKMIGNGVSVPAAEWVGHEMQRYFN